MVSKEEQPSKINALDEELEHHYKPIMLIDNSLTRQLVSFQANKQKPLYRSYKYKEAFSADLVAYLLRTYQVRKGRLLDPFAGIGTTLFAGSKLGYSADGIELLPIGQHVITAHKYLLHHITGEAISILKRWRDEKPWQHPTEIRTINTLKITKGAYSQETEECIGKYLARSEHERPEVNDILLFTLLCILESSGFNSSAFFRLFTDSAF